MGPTGRVSGRGKPINQTAGALQVISELNSVECGASKPHTNMGDDPGAQRGLCNKPIHHLSFDLPSMGPVRSSSTKLRLLDLIVHSLYSHKEVFLRELVSNASDALDKLRFLSVTEPALFGDGGQFGVGFYSAFLVAEKVVVSTKSPKSDKQYVWESVADSSSYVIREETDPENFLRRGTQITLYLREDDKYKFLESTRIKNLVKNYSQFVGFPIYTWQEKSRTIEVEEEEPSKEEEEEKEGEPKKTKKTTKTEKYWDWELANETKPLWMRNSKEVSKEEYNEFYKKAFNEFLDPLAHTHFTTEGELRFYSSKNEEELTSLDEYIENMGENQKAIYYLVTDSLKSAKSAPFLEKLIQKDIEVLYLVEPIDEVAIQNLQTYKEKKFVDISKEDLELGDEDEVKEREAKQEFNLLCDWMKQQLGDKSANMERLMKAQALGDTSSLEFMRGRRILEINPDHPIIKDLNAACKNAPESSEATRVVDLLYDTAIISSGFTPDSPAELGNKIYEMMAMAVGGRWGRVEGEESSSVGEGDEKDGEAEVVEPSEVRAESDPWQD
ncbi:hypothetical protein YC2023_025112 [Brassica napus]